MPTAVRRTGPLLALVAFAQFIAAIDYNIVYVALPEIGHELGFSTHTLQWVVSAYAVVFGGFLLLGGRAGDLLGHRRMFSLALALYGVSSLAGGLATSPALLVGARAFQGLGAALLTPATLALISTTFAEGAPRNKALAVWGGAGAVGLATGSFLGGALTSGFGWPAVFYVNVPLALAGAVAAYVVIPRDPARDRARSFDLTGAIAATLGFTALVFSIVQGPEVGWSSKATIMGLLASVVLIGGFVVVESRTKHPLMPLHLFRNRSLVAAMGVTFVFMGTFGAQYYFFTIYLQNVHQFDAMATGLAFLPAAVVGMAGTKASEYLLGAVGTRTTIVGGLLLGAVGMGALAIGMSPTGGYAALLPGVALLSFGQGIAWTAMFAAATAGVDAEHQGIASAMASTTQQIGAAVGLAVLVAIANAGVDPVSAAGVVGGLKHAGWAAAAFTLAGVLIALTLRSARPVSRRDASGRGEEEWEPVELAP